MSRGSSDRPRRVPVSRERQRSMRWHGWWWYWRWARVQAVLCDFISLGDGGREEGEKRENECGSEPNCKSTRQTDEVMMVRTERDLFW